MKAYVRVVYEGAESPRTFWSGWVKDYGLRTIDAEGTPRSRAKLFTNKCELVEAILHWQKWGWSVTVEPVEENQ